MSSDSLQGLPGVTVAVKGRNQGTFTNDQGVFDIPLLKGDVIEFSSIGYKSIIVQIPRDLKGNQYSMLQLMTDTALYLTVTIIKPRPTQAQFNRDFVNTAVPDDQIEIARQNVSEAKRRILAKTLPADAKRSCKHLFKTERSALFLPRTKAPPQNIFKSCCLGGFHQRLEAWRLQEQQLI